MKMTRFSTLLISAGMAAAMFAPSALADAGSDVSSNWAGYRASTQDGSGFSRVSGSWTEPSADCSSTSGHASFWVGLGGSGGGTGALEQAGTAIDCDATGSATHTAWYELLPAPPVQLDLKVSPGDHVSSAITVNGTDVTITVSNLTTGQSTTKNLTMTDTEPDVSTAEWIAEAPSRCDGSGCQPLTLADFGTVGFTNASATASGHTGTVSDSAWTAQAVTLNPGGAMAELVGTGASGGAQPSALSADGSAFSVSYANSSTSATTSAASDPAAGSGNGYDPGAGGSYDPGASGGYDPGASGGYDPGASGGYDPGAGGDSIVPGAGGYLYVPVPGVMIG